MSVVNMVVGGTTPDGATFVARVDNGGPVRVAVSTSSDMSSPVFTSSQAVDAQGVAKVSITSLQPDTRYYWQVEDNSSLDDSITGQFVTHPLVGSQASFTIGVAGDGGGSPEHDIIGDVLRPTKLTNHPVFDTIRLRALNEGWLAFAHIGDLHYYDLFSGGGFDSTLTNYRRAYDDVLLQPRQHQLYREVPWVYVWDDHDYSNNDSDGTHPDKDNAQQVYRERVPHYDLDDSDAIYQAFQIGRVLFIASDVRSERTPNSTPDGPSKTMLGSAQKAWMQSVLSTSNAKALVWLMPSQWLRTAGSDTWNSFATERDELVELLNDTGWLGRMAMVYADHHALGISSGLTNTWGGFPVLQAASLDAAQDSEAVLGFFDVLPDTIGRNQYGTVTVTDQGSHITIKLSAWRGDEELGSHTLGINAGSANPILPDSVKSALSGSHRAIFEARVLKDFQTGDDPEGIEIPILRGDVNYDSTAEIYATLELETDGKAPDGTSLFPRRAKDMLSPYGNEIFVRRGIDFGDHQVWVPLGYFRINDVEQTDNHPLRISGQDRMSGIVDGRLTEGIQFDKNRTVVSVIQELVNDIYPEAIILVDGISAQQKLGRQVVVEESRHEALLDVAESLGKVVFWDGEGFLRIEDAPEPNSIVWGIQAGYKGVLIESRRRVSREGTYNGVVARGEGATETAVRGIAVDIGASSPTRWGGRFGKVPYFYSSPLLTTGLQARRAARSILSRLIGVPYSVQFGTVTNPALRPRDAIRIIQQDGTRERHIVETCSIPLDAGSQMTGTTREMTRVSIGDEF